jgi:FtsP/CotA-like multicopper oxidase with cupredoxin domain
MLAGCAHDRALAPGARDAFVREPEVWSHGGVVRIALSAVIDPHTEMPSFSYRGVLGPAPTLHVFPGDRIEIAYRDALPANDAMGDMTNLHFHGLEVAPRAPGDDVVHTIAMPGQTLHYVVRIAKTQQPGLYWYHPHAHGATLRQVGLGGMSGAIVVEGIETQAPGLLGRVQRVLVVRDVADSLDRNELADHPELAPPEVEDGATNAPCRRSVGTHITVNGAIDPTIPFGPHDLQLFRLLNATASRFLDISLGAAELKLVALDGVPLRAYPGAAPTRAFSHLVIPPGGRAEFTVAGARGGDRLTTACYDSGPDGDADPADVLATIVAAPDAAIPKPPLLRQTRNPLARAIPAPTRDRTVIFTEIHRNGASAFAINGRSYAPGDPSMFVIRSGTIERWTILNKSHEAHAFHIHQVHFVVETLDGKPVPRYWRDSFTTPPDSRTVALVDFRNPIVRGTFMFHCHVLDHEDGGMMAKIEVR